MSGRTRPLATVPGLLELAEDQRGLVSRPQLRALGVTRGHERNQVEAQRWSRPTPRVIALLTGALDRDQWMWVAQLHAGERSRLFGETALETHGLTGWEPDSAHVAVAHGVRVPPADGLVVHHSRLTDSEPAVIRRGLRCEAPGRAVVSAVGCIGGERRALGLVLAAVQQRIVEPASITRHLLPKTRHAAAIRRILGEGSGADSLSEVDVARLLRRAGLTSYRRQVPVPTPAGSRRFDIGATLADGTLLLIEVDGPHHLDPRVREADAAKDAAALALGHRVIHLPVQVVARDEAGVVEQLRRIREDADKRARHR
jgi:very-short-patch-repair endonuclease